MIATINKGARKKARSSSQELQSRRNLRSCSQIAKKIKGLLDRQNAGGKGIEQRQIAGRIEYVVDEGLVKPTRERSGPISD